MAIKIVPSARTSPTLRTVTDISDAVYAAIMLAGCGRVAFDAQTDAVAPDAGPANISGRTFRYTNFTNQVAALDAVTVELLNDSGVVAMTTSDAVGNYKLTAPAGSLHFRFTRATYQPTLVYTDTHLTGDITATAEPLFAVGDGPLWQSTAINSVYTAAGVPRDATKGTLNIGLRDATGQAVEGVSLLVDPPPGASTYQANDGTPDSTLSATVGPFAHYIGLNALPGLTRVTAMKDGLPFGEVTLVVTEQTSTLAVMHGP